MMRAIGDLVQSKKLCDLKKPKEKWGMNNDQSIRSNKQGKRYILSSVSPKRAVS
jgi:hypothetical protein